MKRASAFIIAIAFASGPALAQAPIVKIDGSSTVFPITEAVAEEFQKAKHGAVRVTVGISGTGGGFERFCNGETDLSNASRPMRTSEAVACREKGIPWVAFTVANDGISIVVNGDNSWASCLTFVVSRSRFSFTNASTSPNVPASSVSAADRFCRGCRRLVSCVAPTLRGCCRPSGIPHSVRPAGMRKQFLKP